MGKWYVGVYEINNSYIVINTDDGNLLEKWKENNVFIFDDATVEGVFANKAKYANNNTTQVIKNDDGCYEIIEFKYIEQDIEELRIHKLATLESIKDGVMNADVLYKDKLYQADVKAKELLTQSLVIFSSVGAVPDNFVWKSSDNSLNVFGLDDLKNLSLLIAQRTQEVTAKYWSYKEQIRNATTKEELDLIKLEF